MSFFKLAYENPVKTIIFGVIAGGVLEETVRAVVSPFAKAADECAGSCKPRKKPAKKKSAKRK